MKILVIHCTYQYRGGEDTVVQEESSLLLQDGHEVEVLLFSNSGNEILKLLQLPFNIGAYITTRKKIAAFRPDVVHIHNVHFGASPSVIYAANHANVPVVLTLHNFRLLCPSAILYQQGKLFLSSLDETFPVTAVKKGVYKNSKITTFWVALSNSIHRWLRTYRIPSRVICLTDHSLKLFASSNLNFRPNQLVIKPNFFALPAYDVMPRGDHFLFVGRLTEEKGIELLLETFALSNLPLLIAGDGPLRQQVEQFAANYANIYYLGNLQPQQVNETMQAASALVFPSTWFEGMPLTIIEAFASGLPVIASNMGAMQSMIDDGETGFLFDPDNKADFQKALYKWAHMNNLEKMEFRTSARSTYNRYYSPEKNLNQLINIYRSVIENNQLPMLVPVT